MLNLEIIKIKSKLFAFYSLEFSFLSAIMRHQHKGKILGRERGPRKALIRSLAVNLVLAEKIKTTEAKAKALRSFVEKIITVSKINNLNSRRKLISRLQSQEAVKKLLNVLGPKYQERKGGYTRIVKLGQRRGDAAKMAVIEFV